MTDLEGILKKLPPEEQAQIRSLIYADALTGVGNRRKFDEDLNKEYAASQHAQTPLSLLMIDIDHFKKYNDLYGHHAGDQELHQVAQTITKYTKQFDTTYRYGGEELTVILPQTTTMQAYNIAERIRQAVNEETHVTISIGVSNTCLANDTTELISSADRACYDSKRLGRNQTNYYTPPNPDQETAISTLQAIRGDLT